MLFRSIGACVNASLLYIGLRKRGVYTPSAGWLGFLLKMVVVLCVFGAALYVGAAQFDWIGLRAHPALRIAALAGVVGAGALLYFALLFAVGFRIADFRRRA